MKLFTPLLFTLFFSSQVFAETFLIDERKTDIYFANGVGAVSRQASFEQGRIQIKAYQLATPLRRSLHRQIRPSLQHGSRNFNGYV